MAEGIPSSRRSKRLVGCFLYVFIGRPLARSVCRHSLLGFCCRLTLEQQERDWDRPYIPSLATTSRAARAVKTPEEDLPKSIHCYLGAITDMTRQLSACHGLVGCQS